MVVRVFDLFKSHNDFYRTSPTILNHTKEKTSLKSLPKGPIFPTLIYRDVDFTRHIWSIPTLKVQI
jgi:hypothetical protein